MSDDLTPADQGAEPGDLTARLRSLEERISSEGAVAPARRRRTPANPAQRYVPPPLAHDDPLADALDETPPAPQPAPEPAASAPEETVAEEPEPAPARRTPVKKAAPRTARPKKAVPAAELGSGEVAAAAVAAASTPPVKKARKAAAKRAATPVAPAPALARSSTGRAPAKRAATAGSTEAAPWPVADPAALATAPVPKAPRRTSLTKPPVAAPEPPTGAPTRPAAVPTAKVATTVPVTEPVVPARRSDLLVRILLTLTVLLLAAAAGLGAAAFVENRDATYTADVVVRLDPGNDPQGSIEAAVLAGMTRYLNQTGSHAFTLTAAQRAGVAEADLRTDVRSSQVAARQIRLAVQASTSAGTQALANGAGDALVELVNLDQASNVAAPGDRLSAAIERPAREPSKTSPKDRDAYAAGGLAAGAVLLLSGVGALLRFTRSS